MSTGLARRALVTGAGRRVGSAIALELGRAGFDVAIHHRSSHAEAARVVAECRGAGREAFAVAADLSSPAGCAALVEAVRARWSRLDVLVNNASAFHEAPFESIGAEEWDAMMAINLRAPFLVSRGLVPELRASGAGLVVHVCDVAATRPMPGYAHYAASKAGLVMLVRAMAVELAPVIRTVGVSPGHVAWPETWGPDRRRAMEARIPAGRVGEPGDVARLVRFLATEGSYVNGEVIVVDGGLSATY